jgi:hypothetical protein
MIATADLPMSASITTTTDLYGNLVPEASGRARDALDHAFRLARMCPQVPPALHDPVKAQVSGGGGGRADL